MAQQPQFDQIAPSQAQSVETATATGADAVLTFDGSAGTCHVIGGVAWSYKTDPAAGRLTIEDGGTVIFDIDIPTKGPGFFNFIPPRVMTSGAEAVVTLFSGAGSVVGKVNANHWMQLASGGVVGVTTTTTTTTTTSTTTTT